MRGWFLVNVIGIIYVVLATFWRSTKRQLRLVPPGAMVPLPCTEWKTFRQLLVKQPQDTTASQLKELVSNDMLKAMFPNLNKIASIGLTIPVSTASVERSFSQMKMIKTRLRNSLSDCSLSHLMRFAIEATEVLSESDLEEIVDVWQRKSRRVNV